MRRTRVSRKAIDMSDEQRVGVRPAVYRSRGQARAIAACGWIAVLSALVGMAVTWGTDRFAPTIVVAAIGVLIGTFLLLRMARAAVYADRDEVRIANVWSTKVLSWDEIVGFAKRPYGPAKVTTVDHRTIDIFAIQQSNWANMRRMENTGADVMIAELNARLGVARERAESTRGVG